MGRARQLVVTLAFVLVGAALSAGQAAAARKAVFVPCHGTSGVFCATVTVPLDRSGLFAGQIGLSVEKLPAVGMARGTMLLLAGGPGQSSNRTFDLGEVGRSLRKLFPGYTLVTYDDRGTGDSGYINCPSSGTASEGEDAVTSFVTECANKIGSGLEFYATRDHALDIEAVREALGVDRVGLFGGSYGTKHALAYALAYPQRVERMILDSVLPTDAPDPLETTELRSIPAAFASLCAGGACRAVTKNPGADIIRLGNKLAAKPLRVRVSGDTHQVDGESLLELVLSADLDPAAAALVPALTRAALDGRPQALSRLFTLFIKAGENSGGGGGSPDLAFSDGLLVATVCNDGPFPWTAGTPPEQRRAAIEAAVNALTPSDLGGFGPWATELGTATMCTSWPGATNIPLAAGPFPDVPVLALAGDRDTRTPLIWATETAAEFPQGHLLVLPGAGHFITGSSDCVDNAIRTWLDGGAPPARCARIPLDLRPIGPYPQSLRDVGARRASVSARTVLGVKAALEELAPTIYEVSTEHVPGLYGGEAVPHVRNGSYTLVFNRFSDIPGLALSGKLRLVDRYGPETPFVGTLRISGKQAKNGTVTVAGPSVRFTKPR